MTTTPNTPTTECTKRFAVTDLAVEAPTLKVTDSEYVAQYTYERTVVEKHADGKIIARPNKTDYTFKTQRKVPRVGLMMVGWGGNNGTTVTAGILANRMKLSWETKHGMKAANFYGSLTQCSTVRVGNTADNEEIYAPFNKMLPMVNPEDLVLGGWDISGMEMDQALKRAEVVDINLQKQLYSHLKGLKPLPAIYYQDYIAANQEDRADNVKKGSKQENLEEVRRDIREFKAKNNLDKVIILWTATTERYSELHAGLNDTADNLLAAIKRGEEEIAPSTIYAVAAILEHTTYLNGSPMNTFVPGCIELAERENTFIAGDDFKTGQTKMKSVLSEFLVSAGLKMCSVVSYNHLGNNDGRNLASPKQFRSKEISKQGVVEDMIESNSTLYPTTADHPDHCIVIKYVPYVGDSKRALDEYTSEIFLGGLNTISMHNTCEDSLLAAPIMIDLVVVAELCERISFKTESMKDFARFDPVLSVLSYLLKAPRVPEHTPVINALAKQRECIVNIMRACLGLHPENNMLLEHKCRAKN
eukprot:TRINITY_DN2488_c0_g1_i1.p2 TRINITY_DN2488_c0_g1~~TRINITY_DN2488_c0_g1_i1.p2  ORF type:complete len:530 (-),score=193.70 TRINITY_DN2488_c0_g1_i1:40-1629(-)